MSSEYFESRSVDNKKQYKETFTPKNGLLHGDPFRGRARKTLTVWLMLPTADYFGTRALKPGQS